MNLPAELISQFAKITNDNNKKENNESTVYGTTVVYNGRTYVKLDGSELLTPVSSTASTKDDERVTVTIKDHTATITGNLSDPSASSEKVTESANQISEFEIIIAHSITTEDLEATNAYLENLKAITARLENAEIVNAEIESLQAKLATIDHLTATDINAINAEIESIRAEFGSFTDISTEDLEAANAEIDNLKAYVGDFTYVSTDVLEAIKADIKTLEVEKLSAKDVDLKYANIDFSNINEAAVVKLFTDSGIIKDLVVSEGHITGELVGVTIKGDLIEAGTVKADKLVVKGSDGIYYKLNMEAGVTSSEKVSKEELQNGLHGDTIIAQTITAEKINVDDLVAFDATIGGFNITDSSIYSGVKSSVDNTTRGAYLDKEGQIAFGDANNYLKYYKDTDGKYRLEISAASILFASSGKSVEDIANGAKVTNSVQGVNPLVLENSADGFVIDMEIEGTSEQGENPTPESPQDINHVGVYDDVSGKYALDIKTHGKNLFDIDIDNNMSDTVVISCNITKPITVSALNNGVTVSEVVWRLSLKYKNGSIKYIGDEGFVLGTFPQTFDASEENPIVSITCRSTTMTGGQYLVQVEYGTEATEYEPYKETAFTILLDEPLCKNDLFIKKDGVWGVERYRYSITFDGSADEVYSLVDGDSVRCDNEVPLVKLLESGKTLLHDALCTHKLVVPDGSTVTVYNPKSPNTLEFRRVVANWGCSEYTIDAWRTLISESPITVEYDRAEPVFAEFDADTQSILNSLVTYNPVTYLSVYGATNPSNMYAEYFLNTEDGQRLAKDSCDAKTVVDNKLGATSNELYQSMVDQNAEIKANYEAAILLALENYNTTGDFEEFKNAVESTLDTMADDIVNNAAATTERINSVEADLLDKYAHLTNWIHIDNEAGSMTFGSSENKITLTVENDMIVFKKNGEQFGWWDGIDFHTGNIMVEVNERAQFGNFAFVPRSDGSLAFLKVGDS